MNRVLTVGGGPAGLYFSLLIKKAFPDLDVALVERNPRGATYGWGVVFSDRTLAEFREADQRTYEQITERFVTWEAIDVFYHDKLIRSGGHVFAGIARVALLDILAARCEELGVDLRFESESGHLDGSEADLVIAADGVHSEIRAAREKVFRPRLERGRAKYIWFGTDRVLDSFTFAFRENDHGFFQSHAYPFDGTTSTWIVETDEETWRRAGLDTATESESIQYCERLFARELRGRSLLSNSSQWIDFVTVRNRTWRDENVALLGDAAHTAHFSIGSGTKLAMEDAISLSRAFERHGEDLDAALSDYELERRPVIERFQEAADESRVFFENTRRYSHLEAMPFAFRLFSRSGRLDYGNLRTRDARYVDQVDRDFADANLATPPPHLTPLRLRGLELPNRIVHSLPPWEVAEEGSPGLAQRLLAESASDDGVGLILPQVVAVSPEGRQTVGSTGLWTDQHESEWAELAIRVHAGGSRVGLAIGHAGRRAGCRPRSEGLDREPRFGGWQPIAPSPVPYSESRSVPEEMTPSDLARVRDAFAEAAVRAARAGFDLLMVHMAHGQLLASFLSPLANVRDDEYGLERMRYPLEVFDAVREAWPDERPLGATIPSTDAARGGWAEDHAVELASALASRGCDLVEPLAGLALPASTPAYGPGFLVPAADRIRNEARVKVLVGGGLRTTSQINTILAGARADLCVLTA
ncbi:MAG: FAD-dependent monooxygenase [Actinomycetota bacterium]